MKAKVWCEVTCCLCGTLACKSRYYTNPTSIAELKKEVSDWVWDKEIGGNLCPKCLEKEKKK